MVVKKKKASGGNTRRQSREGGAKAPAQRESAKDSTPAEAAANHEAGSDVRPPIVLESIITIAEAAVLKELLLPHIGRKDEINIDGSRVESADTAALQVLLAFVRSARTQGATVRWTRVSDALLNAALLLGIARLVNMQT